MPDASGNTAYDSLEARFRRIALVGEAGAVLHWDYATQTPEGGAESRADQLAELQAISHTLLTSVETEDQIAAAQDSAASLDEWQAANLREMSRRVRRARALDEAFVTKFAKACSATEQAWRRARAESDFAVVGTLLAELTELVREKAVRIGEVLALDPYDALLDAYEPGSRAAKIDPVFDDLAQFLPPFLEEVLAHQAKEPAALAPKGPFPGATQRDLGVKFMEILGFDFSRGRIDVSHHPFCGGVPDDVRITTRYDEDDFTSALMGVLHETGHALYSQGLPADWRLQPVGDALGMSIHESQSLLMEMQVCRSRAFLAFAAPVMRETFGGKGSAWETDNLIRLYHKVERSFIRVDADEITYPLHIILRYRLERAILAGDLQIKDLPTAWNDTFKSLIGLDVPDDANGCLQDIHWFDGAFGYFPTYTLGAMTAAQLYQAAKSQDAAIPSGIEKGDFAPLLAWLRENVHSLGRRLPATDLLTETTGRPLEAAPFKNHLRARYLNK